MNTLIETERLLLREITLADTADMFRLHSHPVVQQYTGESVIESVAEMERIVQRRIRDYARIGYGRWATVLKEGQQFIGWSGLAYLPEFDATDIGYRFLPEFWGKGLATEASKAILTYAFDQLDLQRIIALAMKENTASIRVMEKIGMAFEKYAPYEPGSIDVAWYWRDKELIRKHRLLSNG